MADFPSDRMMTRHRRDAWMQDNDRGLALAAEGDWAEASEAFAAAADCLARILPSDTRGVHEPMALVLSNLAQAYFRLGRTDDAMQQAQRACSLRVVIAGEDGMPVARARMDMAVMLASAGRLEEATSLVQRAIAAVEHRVGEEDVRLAIVLENAARIALAAGHPANAEPLLLRLHALLDAHELSTARAEQLLARVAEARAHQLPPEPGLESDAGGDALPAFDEEATARVYAHASIAEQDEWEDQPLRDAVAMTDILLRTTPNGVPVIPAAPEVEPPSLDGGEADFLLSVEPMDVDSPLNELSFAELSLDLTDAHVPSLSFDAPPTAQAASADDTDFDLDLAFDEVVPLSPPTLDASLVEEPVLPPMGAGAVADSPAEPAAGLLLDFAVAHGTTEQDDGVLQAPPISSPVPDSLEVVPVEPPAPTVVPVTQIITSGPTAGIAPMADIVQTAPPTAPPAASPVSSPVAPSRPVASAEAVAVNGPISTRTTNPRSERAVRRNPEERVVLPKSTPPKGKGGLVAIIVGAVAVAGGAAAFFLLR